MLRHDTAAALLLTTCSPVLVLSRANNRPAKSQRVCAAVPWFEWLELDLFTECCNLLIERFPSDTLVSCHTVTAIMERRQCPCRTSYKPFQTELSRRSVALICRSAHASDTVSNWAFFAHDFGWDVRAGFVFDVDDARFLAALQHHFLMACGQHVVRKCSFCVDHDSCFGEVQRWRRMPSSIRHNQLEW